MSSQQHSNEVKKAIPGKPKIDEAAGEEFREAFRSRDFDKIKEILKKYDINGFEVDGRNAVAILLEGVNSYLEEQISKNIVEVPSFLELQESKKIEAEKFIKESFGDISLINIIDSFSEEDLKLIFSKHFLSRPEHQDIQSALLGLLSAMRTEYQKSVSKIKEVIIFLLKDGLSVNAFSSCGYNPLGQCLGEVNLRLAKLFLENGASLTAKKEEKDLNSMPLMEVVRAIKHKPSQFVLEKILELVFKDKGLKTMDLTSSEFEAVTSKLKDNIVFYQKNSDPLSGLRVQYFKYFLEEIVASKHAASGSSSLFWICAKRLAALSADHPKLSEDISKAVTDAKPFTR